MTGAPDAAARTGRRLWQRAAGDADTPEAVADAATRLCAQLRTGLGRWIGAAGYEALRERTVSAIRADHAALGGFGCEGDDEGAARGITETYGPDALAAAVVAYVTALIDLLGRIIGEEMAVRLVEQTGTPASAGPAARGPAGDASG